MNKELEALERLNNGILVYGKHLYECNLLNGKLYRKNIKSIGKYYDLLKQALKRNEPMKPNYGGRFPQCPVCKRLLHSIWQKYCDNCAQAIDWSDDEKTN